MNTKTRSVFGTSVTTSSRTTLTQTARIKLDCELCLWSCSAWLTLCALCIAFHNLLWNTLELEDLVPYPTRWASCYGFTESSNRTMWCALIIIIALKRRTIWKIWRRQDLMWLFDVVALIVDESTGAHDSDRLSSYWSAIIRLEVEHRPNHLEHSFYGWTNGGNTNH